MQQQQQQKKYWTLPKLFMQLEIINARYLSYDIKQTQHCATVRVNRFICL